MLKKDILEKLGEAMKEAFDKSQERPNQYVVAYFKKSDDSLIGYHLSTFCQTTDDILEGKRYAGEGPYPQLAIIAKNIAHTLDNEHTGMFANISNHIKEVNFAGLKSTDIYLDAIYLSDGMPKQDFRYQIIDNTKEPDINMN